MPDTTNNRNNPMSRLQKIVNYHTTNQGLTWYRIAEDAGIRHASLYRFRDGGGLDGENTIRLLAFFNLKAEDLL